MRLPVALALVVAFAGCAALGDEKGYRIPSSSMEPTLHCARPAFGCEADEKDVIVTEAVEPEDLRRGDIVVFETPEAVVVRCGAGGTFVSRPIGLPGERLELRNEGGSSYVYVDGRRLQEPYIQPDRRDTRSSETFTIPAGHYFVMGDNRAQSCDSREWGTLPGENIHHRAIRIERSSGSIDLR
jgi:signal peptidase I